MENYNQVGTQHVEDAKRTFLSGENFYAQHLLGAHQVQDGYVFRVWAPNALAVSLVGDFNDWQDLPMKKDEDSGIWEVFTNNAKEGELYKFKVQQANGREILKAWRCRRTIYFP